MVLEIVGSRVVAPYLGTSVFVWTALIGTILAAMSAGYWWGGRLADRRPEPAILAKLPFLASLWIALSAAAADPCLILLQERVPDIRLGALAAAGILFAVPAVLLGAFTPFAVRLRITSVGEFGRAAGDLFALSTLGSIAGTFLTGFVLLLFLSPAVILFLVAGVLMATSWILRGRLAPVLLGLLVLAGLFAAQRAAAAALFGPDFIDRTTAYHRVWIYDAHLARNGRPIKVFQVNDEIDSAVYRDGGGLVSEYTAFFDLAEVYVPRMQRALLIGTAGFAYPRHLLANHPQIFLDAVEIDPGLTDLARRYFGFSEHPRLRVRHEDARTFLNRNRERYDVIYMDAFQSYAIPFQLVTREALQRAKESLSEDGAVVLNVISAVEGPKGEFLRATHRLFREQFARVDLYLVSRPDEGDSVQNLILIGSKSPARHDARMARDPRWSKFLQHRWMKPVAEDIPVLTDAFAPVERFRLKIVRELTGGSRVYVRERIRARWRALQQRFGRISE